MAAPVSFSRWFGEIAQRVPPRLKAPVATSPRPFHSRASTNSRQQYVLIVICVHLVVIREGTAKAARLRGFVERPIFKQLQERRSWLEKQFPK